MNVSVRHYVAIFIFSLIIGITGGSMSALFLMTLEWATNFRDGNILIIVALPFVGFIIAWLYQRFGKDVVAGNNLILSQIQNPTQSITWRMAPLVYITTILTHLFGGSAGREGTAVQMSSSIADFFYAKLSRVTIERQMILIMGISAGFASVFGTPFAGTIFAIEVAYLGRIQYKYVIPSALAAFVAFVVSNQYPIHHTHYSVGVVPYITSKFFVLFLCVGIISGFAARFYTSISRFFSRLFQKYVINANLRPVVGGVVIIVFVYLIGTSKYIGLGIPTIVQSFSQQLTPYDFLIKIIITAWTLSAGFKGGEVTPLFFIGATLGNALFYIIPLPLGLLAGLGFVAVFAGATNTPLACAVMGVELFGFDVALPVLIACYASYFVSGKIGIYSAQKIDQTRRILKIF